MDLIQNNGKAQLIEYRDSQGILHREIFPKGIEPVEGQGIPYGISFSNLDSVLRYPEFLERELHELGIWNKEDFIANPNEARLAVLRAGLQAIKKEILK